MKDKIVGSSKKKASTTNVRSTSRRPSSVTNPFLLPEFDEENYDPTAEPASTLDEVTKSVPKSCQTQSGKAVSFKKVAKAITKQRKWSSVLKVKKDPS